MLQQFITPVLQQFITPVLQQFITPVLQLSPPASDLVKGDDTVSSTQTNDSLTDQNQDILDDLDDDVFMSSVTNTPAKDQIDGHLHVNFRVDS